MRKRTRTGGEESARKSRWGPPPKPRNAKRRKREYLTPAEVKKLKDAAGSLGRHGHRDLMIILMLFRHALRVTELINLEWWQFDLKRGRFRVRRVNSGDPSIHLLQPTEIRGLRKLKAEYPGSELVFCSERGTALSQRSVHHIVSRAGEEAGFKFPVHPHMLRHAKGFQLAAQGLDARDIQAYFGHRNFQNSSFYVLTKIRHSRGFAKEV